VADILRTARAIFSLLSPLIGDRSTGAITARATDADVQIPRNSYLVPVGGALDTMVLLKTTEATTVTAAGTAVSVISAFGGGAVNLPEGTRLRWVPGIEGVDPTAEVATTLSGGGQAEGFGIARSLRLYEQIRAGSIEEDTAKAKAHLFPAMVLFWDGSDQAEGVSRVGAKYRENWVLSVIASRGESDDLRRAEGLHVLQEARALLVGRHAVDGESFSAPPGIEIGRARRLATRSSSYVYTLAFTTVSTLEKRDDRVFQPWLVTRYDLDTGADPSVPVVDDARYSME
jgi:hypothetical protein